MHNKSLTRAASSPICTRSSTRACCVSDLRQRRDGKSTLIGRLLHDTRQIYEDQLSTLHSDSKRIGTQGEKLDLALLVDGLQAEREQGITIDVAYRYFSTENASYHRRYPGA